MTPLSPHRPQTARRPPADLPRPLDETEQPTEAFQRDVNVSVVARVRPERFEVTREEAVEPRGRLPELDLLGTTHGRPRHRTGRSRGRAEGQSVRTTGTWTRGSR